jgi:hypothetical protein
MLCNGPGSGAARQRWWFGRVHNSVDPCILEDAVSMVRQILLVVVGGLSAAIPQAMHVVPLNDLGKAPSLDVADFDETAIE